MHHKKNEFDRNNSQPVDGAVISQLERVMKRLQATIDALCDQTQPEHIAELNVRNSIHVLKDVRKTLIHG